MRSKVENADLTKAQEMLLLAYADGECRFWGRMRVQLLLSGKRRKQATDFLQQARYAGERTRSMLQADLKELAANINSSAQKPDMWSRVSARIAQEERAEILLGRRKLSYSQGVYSTTGIFDSFSSWFVQAGESTFSYARFGGIGALALTAVMLVTFGLRSFDSLSNSKGLVGVNQTVSAKLDAPSLDARFAQVQDSPAQDQFAASPGLAAVGLNTNLEELSDLGLNSQYYSVVPRAEASRGKSVPKALEVDWMRSRGSVRMIQHPGERSPIFWVRRLNPGVKYAGNLSSADMLAGDSMNGKPIRILDDNVPSAISVNNR